MDTGRYSTRKTAQGYALYIKLADRLSSRLTPDQRRNPVYVRMPAGNYQNVFDTREAALEALAMHRARPREVPRGIPLKPEKMVSRWY